MNPTRQGRSCAGGGDDSAARMKRAEPAAEDDEEADGTEVSTNQLDDIYSRAQQHDAELPEVEPPDTFALPLRPYQKQALGWMQEMEVVQGSSSRELALHPLWEEYQFPLGEDADASNERFYYNPHIGDLSLDFQPASRGARGGILADEMGLGKTIMLASLIHANRDARSEPVATKPAGKALRQSSLATAFGGKMQRLSSMRVKTTLVVGPMSLLGQWRDELERASMPGTIAVELYYGDGRDQLASRLEQESVDVVITSYGTLASEYRKLGDRRDQSPLLFSVTWLRVILDEAHNIKNRSTLAARASCLLKADRRWALTGTPIQNRLTDLYSLLRFLHVEPWGDIGFFNSFLAKPFANQSPRALEIVQAILTSILLRREKSMKDKDGRPIVELPERTLDTNYLPFSDAEREIYNNVYDRARARYLRLAAQGIIGHNFSMIFSVLMRLRQAVCHPMLVLHANKAQAEPTKLEASSVDAEAREEKSYRERLHELLQRFQAETSADDDAQTYARSILDQLVQADAEGDEGGLEECPFCMEQKASKCFLPLCMHHGCRECLVQYLQACEDQGDEPHCPVCRRGPVQLEDLVEASRRSPPQESEPAPREAQLAAPPLRGSTKVNALMEQLASLRHQANFKGIIFVRR